MPRYVILEHDWPHRHWDLMLEAGPVLRTWRLAELPMPGKGVAAQPSGDHRMEYLDYEGPVSSGRGYVRRVEDGTFEWVVDTPNHVEIKTESGPTRRRLVLSPDGHDWSCVIV